MRLLLLLFTVIDWLIDWLIDQTFIISISKEIMQKLTLELDPMCYYIPLLLPVIHYLQNLFAHSYFAHCYCIVSLKYIVYFCAN